MSISKQELQNLLQKYLDKKIVIESITPVSGGDICETFKVNCQKESYFLKLHQPSMYSMLSCEANCLEALSSSNTIRTPIPLAHGITDNYSFLLLEHLELINRGNHKDLGIALANLHQHTQDDFGWIENNWIGSTPQCNSKSSDWIAFWRDNRLGYQTKLAEKNHASKSLIKNCEKLMSCFDCLFYSYSPKASLLHGDLWSGNFSFLKDGTPVIFDPASYYGDREADLAMTQLFGGFNQDFYSAYDEQFQINEGYNVRKDFYNLYHVLNHFNLFGGGYASQAEQLCIKVLREIK